MMEILNGAQAQKRKRGGGECKLSLEDRLLMTLEYWREYRTYFHIGQSRGIQESTVLKNTRWVEDTLIQDGTFSLSGRKVLVSSERVYEVIVVDGTESPTQRPKKSNVGTTRAKRSVTRLRPR